MYRLKKIFIKLFVSVHLNIYHLVKVEDVKFKNSLRNVYNLTMWIYLSIYCTGNGEKS